MAWLAKNVCLEPEIFKKVDMFQTCLHITGRMRKFKWWTLQLQPAVISIVVIDKAKLRKCLLINNWRLQTNTANIYLIISSQLKLALITVWGLAHLAEQGGNYPVPFRWSYLSFHLSGVYLAIKRLYWAQRNLSHLSPPIFLLDVLPTHFAKNVTVGLLTVVRTRTEPLESGNRVETRT